DEQPQRREGRAQQEDRGAAHDRAGVPDQTAWIPRVATARTGRQRLGGARVSGGQERSRPRWTGIQLRAARRSGLAARVAPAFGRLERWGRRACHAVPIAVPTDGLVM